MGHAAICLVTALYAAAAADFALRGKWPLCIIYSGYAAANVGQLIVIYRLTH